MKKKVTIGMILFVSGISLLFFSFGRHVTDYLQTHQSRAEENARIIDENIAETLGDYEATLDYLLNHEVFAELHERWMATGNGQKVEKYLKDHLLLQSRCMVNVVVRQDEETILSVNEQNEYSYERIEGKENYYLCEDAENKMYLGIADKAEDDAEYVIIVDLDKFYDYTVDEKHQMREGVVFVSADESFVIYKEHGRKFVGRTDKVIENNKDTEVIKTLTELHKDQKAGIVTYSHYNPAKKEAGKGHLLAIPNSETQNRFFTLGVVVNFGETIKSIQKATTLAVVSGFLVAGGIALLLSAFLRAHGESKKRKQELQTLQKENLELQEQAHRQRLETIGILTAGVAHEFNNLLTPIMGYSMMAMEQLPDDDGELYDHLFEIYQSSCQAKEVINRLSEMTRKKENVVYEKYSVDEIIEKVLGILKLSQPKKVRVETDLNCGNVLLSCNETLIMQMILNLVLNSFQIMEETGGVVDITTRIEDEQMAISIGDNGPGIMDYNLDKIFEPFFTTKYTMKGVGLGLAIVHQVVDAHQGTITARNKETGGCVFEIYLPLDKENII